MKGHMLNVLHSFLMVANDVTRAERSTVNQSIYISIIIFSIHWPVIVRLSVVLTGMKNS